MATASASAACDVAGSASSDEQHPHHPRDLPLVRAAVPAHGLLDARRRVLGARDPCRCGRDERGAARLPDEERDAGVGTDERLLQGDGVRLVLRDEAADPVEDRPEPELRPLPRAGRPAPVGEGPDAPVAFVDDPVPACSRPWVDAEDFTARGYGANSDVLLFYPRDAEAPSCDIARRFSASRAVRPPGRDRSRCGAGAHHGRPELVDDLLVANADVDFAALEVGGPAWGTACEVLNSSPLVWRLAEDSRST